MCCNLLRRNCACALIVIGDFGGIFICGRMNFLLGGDDSSDLELPELKDDSDFGNLAKYVRRNERRPGGRPEKLFTAMAAAEPV